MRPDQIEIGDPIKDSPVGAGTLTGISDAGYPQVNHIAVTWIEREDGAVYDPHGHHGGTRAGGVRVPAVDLSQMLICPRCKVDRKQAPCGDPHYGVCPMTGIASGVGLVDLPQQHEGPEKWVSKADMERAHGVVVDHHQGPEPSDADASKDRP